MSAIAAVSGKPIERRRKAVKARGFSSKPVEEVKDKRELYGPTL
jgi:hypothetical protein